MPIYTPPNLQLGYPRQSGKAGNQAAINQQSIDAHSLQPASVGPTQAQSLFSH